MITFPPSLWSRMGFFSPVITERTWLGSRKSNFQKYGAFLRLEFLILGLVHTEPPGFIPVQVFLFQHWFPRKLLLMGLSFNDCDSLCLPVCLSNLGGSGLPCDLNSLTDIRSEFIQILTWKDRGMTSKTLHSRLETSVRRKQCWTLAQGSHRDCIQTISVEKTLVETELSSLAKVTKGIRKGLTVQKWKAGSKRGLEGQGVNGKLEKEGKGRITENGLAKWVWTTNTWWFGSIAFFWTKLSMGAGVTMRT